MSGPNSILELLWGTALLRPYVFAFLACFLIVSITQMGLKRAGLFMISAFLIAFLSEYSSTRNGFPYGMYHYIDTTRNRELWIANVPFMDPLSYVFLSYFSIRLAIFFAAPLRRRGLDCRCDVTHPVLRSKKFLLLSPLLFMLMDVIIDPVALRGDRWFLGKIYFYPEEGLHFGVPLSNYAGWYLVGLAITLAYQGLDGFLPESGNFGRLNFPYRDMIGPAVYFSVLIFNLGAALYIGETAILISGMAISGVIFFLFIRQILSAGTPRSSKRT